MKKFLGILILLIVAYVTPVNACSFTFEDYKKTGEVHSLVVGEYVFDLSTGHSPSLEDFSIAARTIPEEQDEYVYEIIYTPVLDIFRQTEVFTNKSSSKVTDWPDFFDTTYNYRTNINISNPDYDIFTCKTDNIKISYSLLNTKGEGDYKTEANRLIDIQSSVDLGSAYYCITTDNECKPNKKINVEGNSLSAFVNYETDELPQHVCAEAFDIYGNTSGVICDNVMVKVDSEPIKINATEEYNNIIEGSPHTVDGLFDVEYSVSRGNIYYFYLNNDRQYILTNLRDLPSGNVKVKAIGRSGSGLITEEVRTINVRKSIVKYDYKTNGGTSASKESAMVSYEEKADLSVTANKEGYTFVGWNTDKDADFALETVNITNDTTLYAIYKKVISAKFEIYNNQGNIPAVAEYDKAECEVYNNEIECEVVVPKISPRVRYEALGWSKEKDDTAEIQGGDKLLVSDNEVIYSVTRNLVPNTATFIVLKDGLASKEVKSCYLYNGDSECNITPDNITSEDYNGLKFTGFSSSKDEVIEPDDYVLNGGKTFYAYYDDAYEVNFVSDSSNVVTKKAGVEFIVNEFDVKKVTTEVIAPTPIDKNNYTILGWRDDLKTEDKTISIGDRIDANSNVTYYAIYSKEITISYISEETSNVPLPKKYTIYYNGGSNSSSQALVTLDAGINIKKSGYIFNGWVCEGTNYDQGKSYTFDTSKTFEAKWTQHATLVIFDYKTNGGTSSNVESSTYIHGASDPIDLTKIIAYKRGYEFVGWSLYPTATSTSLTTYTPTEGNDSVTLYAIYRKNITVKFENIDESALTIVGDSIKKYTIYNNSDGEEITLPNVNSNYSNIEFIGWNTNSNATDKQYSPEDKVKLNSSTTFYTIIKNTNSLKSTYIYYDGNTRKTKTSECFLYNNNTSCTTESGLAGFIYEGGVLSSWSSSPTSLIEVKEQSISSNSTFYAVYDKVLTITYLSGMYTDTTPQSRETNLVTAHYLTNASGITALKANIELSTPDGIAKFVTEGWRTDNNADQAQYLASESISLIEDTTFYGVYSKELTLKYAALGGNPQPENQYKTLWYNSNIKNPENKVQFTVSSAPIKTGVRLESWLLDNDENKKYQPNDIVEITSNSTMYAKWTPNSYKVTLNGEANGGSNPNNNIITKYYEEEFELDSYNAIPKEGYEFVGWATRPNSKDILTEYIIPAENTTLYAVYKKTIKANWIMYDTFAGSSDVAFTTCDIYNNDTECNAQVGRINLNSTYNAIGWSKVRGSTNVDAGLGLTVTITGNTDFYSITKKSQDLVGTFYYFNNGTVTNVSSSCGLYNGETTCYISSPSTPANHNSAVFNAWSSSTNSYVASSLNISSNTNYYAYYNQINEITYHDGMFANDASANNETILTTIEYVANPSGGWSNVPNKILRSPNDISGYTTIGWREDTSKTTQSYNINQSVSMIRSYELYSVYNRTITLSYNANGGSSTPANQTATQYYNSGSGCTSHTFTLANGIARTGYTFKGWRLDSTSGTQYDASASINILKDSKMYAYFVPNNYTVSFNANGGNAVTTTLTVTYDGTYGSLPTPTRTGYTFNGWYTDATNGSKIESSTIVSITTNQTLYAHWTANKYTLTINGNGGTCTPSSISGTYGSTWNTSGVTCTKSGYTFTGLTGVPSSVTGNATATAGWKAPVGNLYYLIKDNAKSDTIDFSVNSKTSGTNGIYTTTETEGNVPVYYYRGAADKVNNNIIYNNMCWKIIRTTETGGVKLIYNGTPTDGKCEATGEATQIGTSKFNTNSNDNAYVGYMYGTPGSLSYAETHANINNSTIKTYIDVWYIENFDEIATKKLEDTVFCNDRSTTTGTNNNTLGNWYGSLGHEMSVTAYGVAARSSYHTITPRPSLVCTNANDKFTVSSTNGNGKLSYPVGLITLDEVILAGYNTPMSNNNDFVNLTNYLDTGQDYWTLSPVVYHRNGNANVGEIYGMVSNNAVFVTYGVRPVVSLISGTLVDPNGDGTSTNPYVVK